MIRALLLATFVTVAAMLVVSAYGWSRIPPDALVPIHWNLNGEPDGFATKPIGLLGLPALTAGIGLLLAVLPKAEPRRRNLLRSVEAYTAVGLAVLGLMAVIHVATVAAAAGDAVDIPALVSLAIGVLFVVAGAYLGKIRSNFIFGIRTPWTLTSERSWRRTHRLGGRLMVPVGLAMVAATVLGWRGAALFGVVGVGAVVLVVVLAVYSYLVWRDDPNRHSFG